MLAFFQSWFGWQILLVLFPQVDRDGHQELLGHDRHCEEGVALDTGLGHADASVGRVRCLEALMAEIEATPPPESLRHSVNMQETVDIMAEYRRILEGVLRKLMLQAWQKLCPAAFRRR